MLSYKNITDKSPNRPIHSIQNFMDIITKERSRSDRQNRGFSLILLRTDGFSEEGSGVVDKLLGIVISRTRISDEIGWYDEGNIGVLLPDTKLYGAKNLADQLISITHEDELEISYKLFVYPAFGWHSHEKELKIEI